ncbi:hypothetical protein PHLGIDRAFT_126330 [Phlebiopsis gigantea 11061_1 CR5-6]|uniref:Uncharacterized protein n=1 Tax=Phlebiopsis gigantea (strain 11061_1 CR5-6) TaxID=745531 RepID=A0A0C3PQP1_PHLG1|nr:hypothetical protein PHLGIDRAFT_126330 [Phlebiopsis gigantea 11061_1 CR5-6]
MVAHNVTVEDSSPLLIYSAGWVDSPNGSPDYHNYTGYAYPDFASSHQTNGTASFDFAFNGTAIYVFGTQHSIGGPFNVVLTDTDISGASTNTIDSSSGTSEGAATTYQSLLYSHTGLTAGTPHNLHLTNGGKGQFDLDFLVVQSDVAAASGSILNGTIDDADPAFTFGGGAWKELKSDGNIVTKYWNNGTERVSPEIGTTAKLDFTGNGVEIHGTWFVGNFSVVLDGQSYGTVVSHTNLTGGMYNRPRELLWFADGLSAGNHTVEMTNLGFVSGTIGVKFLSIDYAVVYSASAADGTSAPTTTASGSSGAQQTGDGHARAILPYNAALFMFFLCMIARIRLL